MPKVKDKTKDFKFGIGADPEFILTMQGQKVDAKQTMELMLSDKENFKYKKEKNGFDVLKYGNIGWDGASSTAEVRPNASTDPQDVVNNLAGIFKEFIKHIKICDMTTISSYSSVGGHIHLEVPKGENWTNEKKNTIHRRLASFYLPILISENKTNLNLRLKQNYGAIKDHRIEEKFKYPDGTPGYTMEFRCPSAEWLTTPKIAMGTIAYLATVYNEAVYNPKSFSKFADLIYKNDKQGDSLQLLAIMEYDTLTNAILKKAKQYIKTFEMYPKYKKEIDYILDIKRVIRDKQKANYNIAEGWDLIEHKMPSKREIFASKKTIQDIAEKKDFDTVKEVMNIHYNDDTKVSLYAEAIKDRVAAYNWKLKNTYFLFGMRKGINKIIATNLRNEIIEGSDIIKTELDLEYINRLFMKMSQKFVSNNNMSNQIATLDFKTGKIKDMKDNFIIIGIPYELRIKEDIKDFIKFIWEIEKNGITKHKFTNLKNDIEAPIEERGDLYKILTKQTSSQNQEDNIVIDQNSRSLQNHMETIDRIRREERQGIVNGANFIDGFLDEDEDENGEGDEGEDFEEGL